MLDNSDCVILPGGMPGALNLSKHDILIKTLFLLSPTTKRLTLIYSFQIKDIIKLNASFWAIKNVLSIHLESIQDFVIGLEVNGELVAPNFTKIAKSGLYFNNFYTQVSVGTSSDSEFTLNTSLMPSNSGTAFVSYFDRTYARFLSSNGCFGACAVEFARCLFKESGLQRDDESCAPNGSSRVEF